MAEIEMVLQHGWALDSRMWRRWQHLLKSASADISVTVAERGYFDLEPSPASFNGNAGKKILVVHSLGLHLVSEDLIKQANQLVIIGGFHHFHEGTERESKLSRIAVRRMLQKLERDPIEVLNDFYFNCGLTDQKIQSEIRYESNFTDLTVQPNVPYIQSRCAEPNFALIRKDLEILDRSFLVDGLSKLPDEVMILHGSNDTIAPIRHAGCLAEHFKTSNVRVHPEGDHALPVHHPKWCLNQIREESLVTRS